MILVYVDDMLVFAKESKVIMNALGQLYELKPESVKESDLYLGANMEKFQLPSGKILWAMTSRTYVPMRYYRSWNLSLLKMTQKRN